MRPIFLALACVAPSLVYLGAAAEVIPSPDAVLARFEAEPGLAVELAAAEPDVVDPIAMAFDERGNLFVVEGRGYPLDEGAGQIALLADADGDGRYARKATFASGLRFPTGLLPWRGGLIVTDAPDVLYLRDTDGDGAADQREVWLTGFATDKTTQLRVNDPTLGPDGWIYFAGGLSAGKVTSPLCPDKAPADLARGDLRFNPHSPDYEVTTGKSQFGMAFDAYGRRFLCMNRVQVQHAVLTRAQLARNPGLAFSETVQNLPEGRVDDLLRGDNAAARIYPISANVTTADSHAGTFSAACAVAVWRGGNLPERYAGRAFSCDPTGNLAHWDELVPDGATFVARRSAERREFLASPDNAFRPVFLAGGPDGALYVCDMARATIEHPQYLPEEVRKRTDFQTGRAEGRIWRVRSAGDARVAPEALPEDPAALVALLGSPNGWAQGSAFRRLAERPGELPADALHLYAREGAEPAGRAAALNLLALAGSLADAEIIAAFADPHPGVRETALRHAESRASKASDGLKSAVADLADDEDARVRFCCALAMAGLGIDFGLEKIALKGAGDRWTRAAVITAAASREEELADSVIGLAEEIGYPDGFGELMKALSAAQIANAKDFSREDFVAMSEGVSEEFVAIGSPAWFFDAMVGVADGFAARGERGVLREAAAAHDLSAIAEAARAAAPDNESALRVLGLMGRAEDGAILLDLLRKTGDAKRQALLVEALGDSGMEGTPAALGDPALFNRLLPAARERALARFGAEPTFASALVAGIEAKAVGAAAISPAQRSGMLKAAKGDLLARMEALFTAAEADRVAAFEKAKASLALNGDPANGRGVFTQLCAACHRLDGQGIAVGPDLFGMRNQPKEAILLHIIVPNREIAPGFEAYLATPNQGAPAAGLLAADTPDHVTLKLATGIEQRFARDDLESLQPAPASLMPDGLEAGTDPQGLADLLAYLRGE